MSQLSRRQFKYDTSDKVMTLIVENTFLEIFSPDWRVSQCRGKSTSQKKFSHFLSQSGTENWDIETWISLIFLQITPLPVYNFSSLHTLSKLSLCRF